MRFGYFDDARREYVITTPRTPLPWINYLGSEAFFTLCSNTAAVIEGRKGGVAVSQELLVPQGDDCLLMRVTVRNDADAKKELRLFPYVEFCLWDAMDDASNFQRNYSTGEVEVCGAAIYHKTEYRERRDHYAVFWADRTPDGFDTSRDAFIGVYGSPARPEAVFGDGCTNSVAHGWQPIAAQQFDLSLAPGESASVLFGLGYIENPREEKWAAPGVVNKTRAEAMIARYAYPAAFDEAMEALRAHWDALLSNYRVSSGEEKLDRMVNIWNQYQCMVTFNMSRSASYFESGMGRGMGFRDSCQDLLGFVHMIPERARERILDIAATQFPDGSAYHQYQPLTKKGNLAVGSGFNDDPLWLIAGTDAYLRETGDWSILDEIVDFDNDPGLAQPLLEHLRRSFNYTRTHLGPHGLPLIGRADWNDCLNLNCFSSRACSSSTAAPGRRSAAMSVSRTRRRRRTPPSPRWRRSCWTRAGTAPGSAAPLMPSVMSSAGRSARRARSSSSRRACASWPASAGKRARRKRRSKA